jgi:hypothetical protein
MSASEAGMGDGLRLVYRVILDDIGAGYLR